MLISVYAIAQCVYETYVHVMHTTLYMYVRSTKIITFYDGFTSGLTVIFTHLLILPPCSVSSTDKSLQQTSTIPSEWHVHVGYYC